MPINWATVIKSFDWPDRHGVDTATLKLLIAILLNSPRDTEPHAVTGFWVTWNNPLYQLRLLDALLSLPADTFNFVQLPGRRIVTVDDVAIASPTIKSLAANVQGHTWNSLDLFEVLVRLADSDSIDIRNCVREMLDKAIKISAELVHMGLLQVPVSRVLLTWLYLLAKHGYSNQRGMRYGWSTHANFSPCSSLAIPTTNSYSCGYGKLSRRISRMHSGTSTKKIPSTSPESLTLLKT